MQDFDRLIARFRQFGGMRLVWQYAKMSDEACKTIQENFSATKYVERLNAIYDSL